MITIPFSVFFYVRSLYEYEHPDRDLWSGLAAVVATNLTIIGIAIWKYFEDFKAVFWDGTGDIPYDPEKRAAVAEAIEKAKK